MADDGEEDLRQALAGLSGLLSGHQPLNATLTRVAEFAVQAIPGADGAGLTLLREGRHQTVVASADFVQAIDDVQYGIGQGPCITAAETGRTVVAGSLGGDEQWPRFGPRIGRMGVHSALSLPLLLGAEVLGAMNIYAHAKDAFGPEAVRLGELFAGPAAVSVFNARVLADSQRLVDQLSGALTNRATIDQAIGLVIGRTGVPPAEAAERLKAISSRENVKVADLARQMVDEAIRQARA